MAFYSTQRIGMRKVKLEKSDGITDDDGMKVSARVAKNRVAHGNPYKACKYTALYGEGIDRIRGVALTAVDNGIVQGGSWIYYPNKENVVNLPDGTPAKWNGMGKFVDFLKHNHDFVELLQNQIEHKAKSGDVITDTLDEEEIKAIEAMERDLADDEFEEVEE